MSVSEYRFNDTVPIAPLGIIAMENCIDFAKKVDSCLVAHRKSEMEHLKTPQDADMRHCNEETFLIDAKCPRFGTGEAKGIINESVRGRDLFILTDVVNHSLTYTMYGCSHRMSPDDHYQDLKRIIAATMPTARRVNVIMPFLYESRQHKRKSRESLDCAMALEEIASMGVTNIITFDAHDPRVQNAIPLHDFDSFSAIYQFMTTLFSAYKDIVINKKNLMVISPDEGAMERAVYLANNLGVELGMFYKRRDYSRVVNGKNPIVAHEFLGTDVKDKIVIVIDDMISSGDSMIDTAKALKSRGAKKVVVCCTFGLFTNGFDAFDAAYDAGIIDLCITTNLNYRDPEILKRPWYREADLTRYMALIINTLNHDLSTLTVLDTTEKMQSLITGYKDDNLTMGRDSK